MFSHFYNTEKLKKITYMVAMFLFLFEVRPLETYLTAYLTGPNGNVSLFEVANTMEAIKSYSALSATTIILATSQYFYKKAIVVFTFISFVNYILMLSSSNLTRLRVSMAGIAVSSNAYILAYSYMYAHLSNKEQYQEATSIASISLELGIFAGSIISQIIVAVSGGKYTALPYCNAIAMFLAVICACQFPEIKRPSFLMANVFNENTRLIVKNDTNKMKLYDVNSDIIKKSSIRNIAMRNRFNQITLDFKTSYGNTIVLIRSFWHIISLAAHFQIITNMNVLYTVVVNRKGNNDVLENGFAESMVTLCGAIGAYLIGKVRFDLTYYSDVFTAFCSTIMGTLMISCYFCNHLFFIYLSYILYGLVSQIIFVFNTSEIAKNVKNRRYSLVFGFNLFGALLTSTILTIFFIQVNFLNITIPGRFLFIGGLDVFLGVVFLFLSYFGVSKSQ